MKKRLRIVSESLKSSYIQFQSSIYGRVVFVIAILSVVLFFSIGIIFRSVYSKHLASIIQQNGNNIGSIVEGALYHSMLQNDKTELQNTLDVIDRMSGVDEVNMYDQYNQLVYSSFAFEDSLHSDPNCLVCHEDLDEMFPAEVNSYRIIDNKSDCSMTDNDNGHRHLLIRTPILNQPTCYTSSCHAHPEENKILGSIIIKSPLDELDNNINRTSTEFFFFSILATFLLMVLLIILTKSKIQKPLSEIIKASVAVAKGDHKTRMPIEPKQLADMQMVSKAFNHMMDNLEAATVELENWSQQLEYKVQKKSEELSAAQNELIHIERIASLGKLSASVAHELNNPLSGILVYTKLILKQMNDSSQMLDKRESMMKHLHFIENETKRCGDIVKRLLDFSRKDQNSFEACHLHFILKETSKIVNHSIRIANIRFIIDFKAEHDLILCNSAQIKQALIALLVNATEAILDNGEIVMQTRNATDGFVEVEISDNGTGITEDNLVHIFEPFFSTKHQTSGIGLGLAIVHGIIQNHDAKIEVQSKVGEGTTFRIIFPIKKTT